MKGFFSTLTIAYLERNPSRRETGQESKISTFRLVVKLTISHLWRGVASRLPRVKENI